MTNIERINDVLCLFSVVLGGVVETVDRLDENDNIVLANINKTYVLNSETRGAEPIPSFFFVWVPGVI